MKKIKKKTKKVRDILNFNLSTLIAFELIFKIMSLIIFTPLFLQLFNLIMKITGYNYLTFENILSFLSNPITVILLVILVFLLSIYSMFDISTIIIILEESYRKKKITVLDAIKTSLNKCKKLFNLNNIMLPFMVLFLIPFLNIGITSSYISAIKVPEFILDFIIKDKTLLPLSLILIVVLSVLLLRWIYSLHYLVLEDIPFKEARRKSEKLSKNNKLKDLLSLTKIQIAIAFFYIFFLIVGILLIFLLDKIFKALLIKSIIATIIWLFIAISVFIYGVLVTPISYACISVLYYSHKLENNEVIKELNIKSTRNNGKLEVKLKKVIVIASTITFGCGAVFTYGIYSGNYNLNIEHTRRLEVTAHRGASIDCPENTMSSFVRAKELGADWIELDVQMTKDGKIIVIHDDNFKRTTGVDKNVWELNFDEIRKLDSGSYFSEEYKGERIPSLGEVIEFAKKNGMKLNIELKPSGNEKDFEKTVIDIITKLHFENNCVITSQIYSVLENVKNYNNNIKTVYVLSLAYGDITSLKSADSFSIEATSITKKLVKRVHKEGKELYAWTVNTEENINKMIDLNVDNIITDNILLAKQLIYSSKTSNLINEYAKFVEEIF